MPKTVVVIPTYNEAENIERLMAELLEVEPGLHLLVVDDHSPDGTWQLVEAEAAHNPHVHLLHRKKEKGRGTAGLAGFRWALKFGADYVVEMDADFSHQPKFVPHLLAALEEADFVLGSRYVKGGRDADRDALRQWVSILANAYTRKVLGVSVRDCTSGFRAYRAEVLEALKLHRITTVGPAILSDILYRIKLKGFRMREVPIEFIDRSAGKSTLTLKILLEGLLNVLRLRWRRKDILRSLR
jgi:dolichol-phosphate mannosyltransferase